MTSRPYPAIGWELERALSYADVRDAAHDDLPEELAARYFDEVFAAVLWIDRSHTDQTVEVVRRDASGDYRDLVVSATSDWHPPPEEEFRAFGGRWLSGLSAGTVNEAMGGPILFGTGMSVRQGVLEVQDGCWVVTSSRPEDRREAYFVGRISKAVSSTVVIPGDGSR